MDLQQLRAHALDVVAQLPRREAVGGEGIEDAVGVTELVVETGSDDTGREGAANVADLLAHLVPSVRHILAARRAEQVDEHRRDSGGRVTAGEVEVRRLLQLLFDAVGDLLDHLVDRGAGPRRLHDHRLDRECRIFVAAEALVGKQPGRDDEDHEEPDERAVAQCPVREIQGVTHVRAQVAGGDSFTCCPGRSAWTPAVTMTSPFFSPLEMMTDAES